MIFGAEIQYELAFRRALCFVHNIAAAGVKADAVLASCAIIETGFRHVVAVAPAAAEPVRKLISWATAGNLPTVPVRFPAGHYSVPAFLLDWDCCWPATCSQALSINSRLKSISGA